MKTPKPVRGGKTASNVERMRRALRSMPAPSNEPLLLIVAPSAIELYREAFPGLDVRAFAPLPKP